MKYKGKNVKVVLIGNAKVEYDRLNKIVGEEIKQGIQKSEYQTLFRSINTKKKFIEDNPEYGDHIEKKKIPKEYIREYEINNLWRAELSGS